MSPQRLSVTYAPFLSRHVACVSTSASGIFSVSRHVQRADFVIFALFSGVYLNLLNYWKVESSFHI